MKLNKFKNNITYLLLAIFFTMKIAGLHSFTNLDNNHEHTDCAICEFIALQNSTPILSVDLNFTETNTHLFIFIQEPIIAYNVYFSDVANSVQLFCRPPPLYC